MYLHASDKASGVENFHSAVGSKLIRREMITEALRKGLSPRNGLEQEHFKYAKSLDKPLAVGVLGVGQQGVRLLAAINPAYVTLKAIADIRPSQQKRAVVALQALAAYKGKWKTDDDVKKDIRVYDSYEKLLAAAKTDGLEAVIIALPSHLHAAAAMAAMDAGLHVFVETPLALKVLDAKQVARKAAEKNLVVAVGQQRYYNWIYDHALEMVRLDLLEDVHYVRAQWHVLKPVRKTAEDDAKKAKNNKKLKEAVQKPGEFKIDWWQDVPPEESHLTFDGYASPEELVHWQLYEKYSGGLLAELGSQIFDAAVMFIKTTPNRDPQRRYPLSVAGAGSQTLREPVGDADGSQAHREPVGDIDDHVHCIFEYPIQGYVDDKTIPPKARKKIALQVDLIIGNEFDGYGETVLGRQGSLVLENEHKAMLFHTSDVDKTIRVDEKKVVKKAGDKKPDDKKPDDKKDIKGVPSIVVSKADEESQSLGRLALQGADAGFATELEHWACCCKPVGGKVDKPRCDAEAGLYTTVLTVAAARALATETRVDFKDAWFDVKSDETPDNV